MKDIIRKILGWPEAHILQVVAIGLALFGIPAMIFLSTGYWPTGSLQWFADMGQTLPQISIQTLATSVIMQCWNAWPKAEHSPIIQITKIILLAFVFWLVGIEMGMLKP